MEEFFPDIKKATEPCTRWLSGLQTSGLIEARSSSSSVKNSQIEAGRNILRWI